MIQRVTPVHRLLPVLVGLLLFAAPFHAKAQGSCEAYAGVMNVDIGPVCLQDGQALLTGTPSNDAVVPPGYTSTYLLTRTNALTIEQMGPSPNFMVNSADIWRIHRLVSDPAVLDLSTVQLGETSAYDIYLMISQGGGPVCASISMTYGAVKTMECEEPCKAFASGVTMDTSTICLSNGQATLTALPSGTSIVPAGYQVEYLLTRTNGLIIEQMSSTPTFTVNSEDIWRIHNLVFDTATLDLGTLELGSSTAYDLQSLLLQGGGSICASLDISGAPVKTGDCDTTCSAEAGVTSADQSDLCLTDGIAVLSATPDGAAVVPQGFDLAYFLTEGNAQIIQQTGTQSQFTVGSPGMYAIHAFVYNPYTISFSGIVLGTTTIADLNAQLMQGGGGICASLELAGADLQVVDCTPACDADAGSMLGESAFVCLLNGSATLSGISFGDTVVPAGFSLGYLLSQGPNQVLVEMGSQPQFNVQDTGTFRIHAFVYDPSSWAQLQIQWGSTTIYALSGQLVQGGGAYCGGLDVLGTPFTVEHCPPPCSAGLDTTVTVCITGPSFELFGLLHGNPCPNGTWTTAAAPEVSGIFNPASSPAGPYFYVVMLPNGMMDTSSVTVNVFECPELMTAHLETAEGGAADGTTGVNCPPDLSKQNTLRIRPNPASGMVYVTLPFSASAKMHVELLDATGRSAAVETHRRNGQEILLDTAPLASGVWTLRVVQDGRVHWGRFVRQ